MISTEDYVKKMRKSLCSTDISKPNGDLNHSYFLDKKNHYWSQSHQTALIEAIEKHGIGNWEKIKQVETLKNCYDIELELRTCVLLGTQSINEHWGKKYTVDDIKEVSKKKRGPKGANKKQLDN